MAKRSGKEEEVARRRKRNEEEQTTLVKSNNPHLAGREKTMLKRPVLRGRHKGFRTLPQGSKT